MLSLEPSNEGSTKTDLDAMGATLGFARRHRTATEITLR